MIIINDNKCIGCGQCDEFCRIGAIKFHTTSGYARAYIDKDICVNCKLCIKFVDCPGEAFKDVIID